MALPQKTVIVAEDEPLVRMLAADALQDAGYTVIEASHAAEAIAALESNAGEVLALFTDVHMPGQYNGLELARIVHEHWPRVAIVVTSGQHRLTKGDMPPQGVFVTKPYDLSQIVSHIKGFTGV